MDYQEALRYIDSFVNYERIGYKKRGTFKLDTIRAMAKALGNPERAFRSVHIAGTKGKGSIASFVSSILRSAGYRTGLYTSPHLEDPRERIRIGGNMIREADFASICDEIKKKITFGTPQTLPSFFEMYTMLAFKFFMDEKVDFAVVETGLGGRLDATNIIEPDVSCISPISYDHMDVLGNTLSAIAEEKCGIIKERSVCVTAPQEAEALEIIKKRCALQNTALLCVGKDIIVKERSHSSEKEEFDIEGTISGYGPCESRLIGRHQLMNAACAAAVAESLIKKGADISRENVMAGIRTAENSGRCETVSREPYVILDGAQNAGSAKALKDTLKRNFNYDRLVLVLGMSREKDFKGVCKELVPAADTVILTKSRVPRAEEPEEIRKYIEKEAIIRRSVREAVRTAEGLAGPRDAIVVTGSFFVIAEVKESFRAKERCRA